MIFNNLYDKDTTPNRVVVLGSNGFISSSVIKYLSDLNIDTLNVSRKEFDLENSNSVDLLSDLIDEKDTILFIAANAPVKNNDMLLSNLLICKNICNLLDRKKINHLIHISSDAIYKDSAKPLDETSCAEPNSLHGLMHLSREIMIKNIYSGDLCILRPTLIFGIADPHNGYGPNSFFRKAINNDSIKIFGKGEERRDHVYIDDVSKIILFSILRKSIGKLNIVSGRIVSFLEIAKKIIKITNSKSKIEYIPRIGDMPHNGYRQFDAKLISKTYPDFVFNDIDRGIIKMIGSR